MIQYRLPAAGILVLTESACAVLRNAASTDLQTEVGGILLGRCFDPDVHVERASMPGPGDVVGTTHFTRSAARAQGIINEAWTTSAGEVIYLGEWHSHPEPRPRPSGTDKEMIRTMRTQTKMEIGFLLLVIVGWKETWIGLDDGRSLRQLRLVAPLADSEQSPGCG